jgi:hypothetical protein
VLLLSNNTWLGVQFKILREKVKMKGRSGRDQWACAAKDDRREDAKAEQAMVWAVIALTMRRVVGEQRWPQAQARQVAGQ